MPTLNQLIRNRATVTIETEDPNDPLIITYQPAAITPRLEAISDDLRGRDDVSRKEQVALMDEYLTPVLHSWNFSNPDGSPMPCTPETITALDYEAKTLIFAAVTTDAYPGEANGANSSEPLESTSKPMEPQATKPRPSRRGTR
jgi:hypothetical protein